LKVDPNLFQNYNESIDKTDLNTLVYRLDVTCRRKRHSNYGKKKTVKHETDVANGTAENSGKSNDGLDVDYSTLENGIVYSSDLKWIKQGSQEERLKGIEPRPVHDDIVLAKLRPGQHISLECHAVRGTGKEHAKFSPVCTAHYRMMPEVKIVKDVFDDKARKLLKLMPGVFELEKVSGKRVKAVVKYPQNCRMSRNYAQDEVLRESVVVTRRPDHFIFSIESVGQLPPEVLFRRAVQVLISKCDSVIDGVKKIRG
jgi:DNA-directed RNA polymerase I and III subunit RPAC1